MELDCHAAGFFAVLWEIHVINFYMILYRKIRFPHSLSKLGYEIKRPFAHFPLYLSHAVFIEVRTFRILLKMFLLFYRCNCIFDTSQQVILRKLGQWRYLEINVTLAMTNVIYV